MRLGALLAIALVVPVAGQFISEAETPKRAMTRAPREAALQTSVQSSYPEMADGLKGLLQDLFSATKAGDKQKSSELLESFAIPNHEDWFLKNFGPVEGARLEARYKERKTQSLDLLKKQIESSVEASRTVIDVTSATKPDDTQSRLIRAVLGAVVQPTTVYTATDSKGSSDNSPYFLGNFIYTQGRFRYVDVDTLMALSTAPPGRIRIGGNVMRPRLVKEVAPEYPTEARTQKVSGTVALRVVIGTDGKVQQAQAVSGNPILVQAALDAVKQWVYQPTLLNGKPVEVETEVNVNFKH